jgi:hypothetical protein
MLKRCGDKALEQSSARANELTGDGDRDAPTPGAGSPPPLPSLPTPHSPRRRTDRTGPETVGSGRPIYLKKARWHEYGRRLTPSASAQE